MCEHLWPFLRLKAANEDELKDKYRKVYLETYVRDADGNEVELHDWTGRRVRFNEHNFGHAFSESMNYKLSAGIHDVPFSMKRALRILWIREVLSASAGTTERWHNMRRDSRNRPKKHRVLLVIEEKYVVVLEEQKDSTDLQFISAYPTNDGYINNVIKRESVFIERKKPQS